MTDPVPRAPSEPTEPTDEGDYTQNDPPIDDLMDELGNAPHSEPRPDDRPKHPFFKDERILNGRVQLAVSVRLLLIALFVFVLLVTAGLVYVINSNQRITDIQKRGRAERIHQIAVTNTKVSELACFLSGFLDQSTDPDTLRIAGIIEAKYHCKRPAPGPGASASPSVRAESRPRTTTPAAATTTTVIAAPAAPGAPAAPAVASPALTRSSVPGVTSRPTRPNTPTATQHPSASSAPTPPREPTSPSKPASLSSPPPVVDVAGTLCSLTGVCLGK